MLTWGPYLQFDTRDFTPFDECSDSDLKNLGFRNIDRVKAIALALRQRPVLHHFFQRHARILSVCLAATCDPDQAYFMLQRWLEACEADAILERLDALFVSASPQNKDEIRGLSSNFPALLCKLFAATPALSEYLLRFPARTGIVLEPVLALELPGRVAWEQIFRDKLSSCNNYSEQITALRRMRVECMLQVAALDLNQTLRLANTTRALSDLADLCLQGALEMVVQHLLPRLGTIPIESSTNKETPWGAGVPPACGGGRQECLPHLPLLPHLLPQPHLLPHPPFVIFALGKLGGRELNYSSDIDLVFTHAGEGETSGGTRSVDAQFYFTAIAEELIAALDKLTDDRRVYRVDSRLRPHGSAGALVKSHGEMLNYYQTEGRTWERQAWLKARPAAGDLPLGEKLLQALDPFVFRSQLSLEAIGDIKALKRQIELGVTKRGEFEDEIKLGRGGIRDIEFTVQFLQLLYGGEHPRVRGGNTLRVLYELRHEGLLADAETAPLQEAYVFLRQVEHRLQLHGDLQVHRLPSDAEARRRIAISLGYEDKIETGKQILAEESFEEDRLKHTARTREVFLKLFANLFQESSGLEVQLSDLLLAPQPDTDQISKLLPYFGFAQSTSSARELIELSHEKVILTSPSRTRKVFASIAPKLLKALAATGEPNEALGRFSQIAGSLGAKAMFYQMLNENAWVLKMTADLAAWSEYLTAILVANPGLFDELVDALQTGQSKSVKERVFELSHIAVDGDIAATLRAYRAGELLRIGVRDLIRSAGLEQTQSELSDLAEAILRTQLEHTLKAQYERRGHIKNSDGREVGFAVLGLGKFGGREMNYGSDLDVIYFYDSNGQNADGLPAVSYFAELAQELRRSMATPTAQGSLYELDARLRPNGTKGPLSISLDDFKRYWKEGQLADWERLALTRARFVAGDDGVGERALHLIRSAIYSPLKESHSLAREVVSMRHRLEENASADDMKRGRGGIMDIEFIAQYLQLIHGPAFPPLRQANTEQSLNALIKFKKIAVADGGILLSAYVFLRQLENRVRVVHGLAAHQLPAKPEALRKLALRVGYADAEGNLAEQTLLKDYLRHTQQVREIFERVVK